MPKLIKWRLVRVQPAIVFLLTAPVSLVATTSAANTNIVAPTLNVSATVQSVVSLTLATGTAGCAISAGGGGDYSMSFGNVNGLGLGAPTCGVVASASSSGATYATTYQMTPTFSGFASTAGTAVVITTSGFTHSTVLSLGEAATTAGPFTTIPASGNNVSVAAATSGTAINRAMSLAVTANNGGPAFTGNDSALVTYTLTVQ